MNILPLLTEAERYLMDKDVDRAAELYQQAHKHAGTLSPLPIVGLARIAILTGRTDDAQALLDHVLLTHPQCAEAIVFRGVVEESKGHLTEALAAYTKAIAVDSELAVAHVNLGRALALLHRWSEAVASYQLGIRCGARGADLQVQLGTAFFRAGNHGDALKLLTLTVQAYPQHLDALLTLADVLVETGGLSLAAQLLDNAAARMPSVALIASRRKSIALRQKDLEGARAEAWRHTRIAPKDEEAWLFAAVVDTMVLRFDSAEQALRQVLKLNAKNWRAHYHLGGLFDALKDARQAKESYRAAISCEPQAWEPLNNLGTLLLEEGTPSALAEARTLLERAVRLNAKPAALLSRYNLALVCYKLGDTASTRQAAKELLKLAPPTHPMAQEAHRVLRMAA